MAGNLLKLNCEQTELMWIGARHAQSD